MTDDDEPAAVAGHDPLARVYDYFKHLTTLALIAIGGVLGLLKGEGPTLKPLAVAVIIGVIATGAVVAQASLAAIAGLGLKDQPPEKIAKLLRGLPFAQGAATFLIMLGMGIFLGNFVGELGR